ISILPPLRWLDSAGGSALGLCTGLAICWVIGATLLYLPGQTEGGRRAEESRVVSALTQALPPATVMDAVVRIDPFAAIVGPAAGVDPPDPALLQGGAVRAARAFGGRTTGIVRRSSARPRLPRRRRRSSASPASPAGSASKDRDGSWGRSWSPRTRT